MADPRCRWAAAPGGAGLGPGSMSPGGSAGPGGTVRPAPPNDAMIVIKVDADKLPKAADLKAHLFPTTFAISVADQEIRFVSRGAFPDLSVLIGMVPAVGMMPAVTDARSDAAGTAGAARTAGDARRRPATRRRTAGRRPGGRPGGRGRPGRQLTGLGSHELADR